MKITSLTSTNLLMLKGNLKISFESKIIFVAKDEKHLVDDILIIH